MTFMVRRLEGWLTFRECAAELGYDSAQGVRHLVFVAQVFAPNDVRYIETGNQPLYLVRASAVQAHKVLRAEVEADSAKRREEAQADAQLRDKTVATRKRMRALLGERQIMGRAARARYVGEVLGREVDDWYLLDLAEADKVIAALTAK